MMRQDPVWGTPPAELALAKDEVHVWRAKLDLTQTTIQSLRRTLAADELARAKRFRFAQDRDRFIAARGVLRAILSRYLKVEPARVYLTYNAHGKPTLDAKGGSNHAGYLCSSTYLTLVGWPYMPSPTVGRSAWTSSASART